MKPAAPVIYGDGTQSRDFTYVSDAVEANLRAAGADSKAAGRAYNVAGGQVMSVNELAAAVREAVGGGPAPRYDAPRAGDVLHSAANLELAGTWLGYRPAAGIAQGLARSLDYYRSLVEAGV